MTPTLPEILRGNFLALATPPTAETAGDYLASRIGVVALLSLLAAQEAERGDAAVRAENAAIDALLADAADAGYAVTGHAEPATDDLQGCDRANARLRRALIALHEAVEQRHDGAFDARILKLYVHMAAGRRLDLPPLGAAG
ncbi:MAG TPA: hypothetical protein VM900_07195 [Sphingomonas sp.]|jgi:hypothetical protein|nr:hypothetical protein [Sphingomonas sp.]